jgi:hypothetical protein
MLPPWVHRPLQPFWWGGWRQGLDEPYMIAWLEFWVRLPETKKVAYLEQYQPDEDWAWWLSGLEA